MNAGLNGFATLVEQKEKCIFLPYKCNMGFQFF